MSALTGGAAGVFDAAPDGQQTVAPPGGGSDVSNAAAGLGGLVQEWQSGTSKSDLSTPDKTPAAAITETEGLFFYDTNSGSWTHHDLGSRSNPYPVLNADKIHNTVYVGPGGAYGSLNDAYSSITDASASNRYQLVLTDDITEPSVITAKSHVHVDLGGYDVTVDDSADSPGWTFSDSTDIEVKNGTVVRAGNFSSVSTVYVVQVDGTTDDTVSFDNVSFDNQITGTVPNNGHAVFLQNSAAPEFVDCRFLASDADNNNYGLQTKGTAAPDFSNCYFEGSSDSSGGDGARVENSSVPAFRGCVFKGGEGTSTGNNGIEVWTSKIASFEACEFLGGDSGSKAAGAIVVNDTLSVFEGCYFEGGDGGEKSYGAHIREQSEAAFSGCIFQGGSGGSDCYGLFADGQNLCEFSGCQFEGGSQDQQDQNGAKIRQGASPSFSGCTFRGGRPDPSNAPGSHHSYGVRVVEAAAPEFDGCAFEAGDGGGESHAAHVEDNAAPRFSNCRLHAFRVSTNTYVYDSASESFEPYPNIPYQLLGIIMRVDNTQSATLDIGTSSSGTEIASGVDLSSSGWTAFDYSRAKQSADGDIHVTPSASIPDETFKVFYVVASDYSNAHGLRLDTFGHVTIRSCAIIGSGSDAGVSIEGNSTTAQNWEITDSHLGTLDKSANSGAVASSSITGSPIYECTIAGGVTNISAASGTSEGTNTTY